jgi:hypothetical protein
MNRTRTFVLCTAAIPMVAIALSAPLSGCSSDSTAVVEGDPAARRKQKDDAMKKKMKLNGNTASGPSGRGSSKKVGPAVDSF